MARGEMTVMRWCLMIALGSSFCVLGSAPALAQSTLSISQSTTIPTPTGSEFQSAASGTTNLTYSINCSIIKCKLFMELSGAPTVPSGASTVLSYSVDGGGSWAPVPPSTSPKLVTTINNKNTPTGGSILLRYSLGWANSPFTPAGSYLQSIKFTLQQKQ